MKLLIDIPEHVYEHAKESSEDSRDEGEAMRAIANGTQPESSSEIPNTCGDAISRQAVLDIIAFEDKWLLDAKGHNANTGIAFGGMRSKVSTLPPVNPKQRTGRWIPVSERLPEDGQSVLFCDIDNDIMIGYHVKGRPDTHFSQDGTYDDMKDVRAWMPLPEPYKAESEDKK